jgi:hypothetical protein
MRSLAIGSIKYNIKKFKTIKLNISVIVTYMLKINKHRIV